MKKEYPFIFIYKTTNTLNGMIYIGVHKTNNLNDGYMGSGTRLRRAIDKIGIDYFQKEILEYFDTWEDALKREKEIVDEEFVKRKDTYNMTTGGGSFYHIRGTVTIKNDDGTFSQISQEEYRKNRVKYKTHSSGNTTIKTKDGYKQISLEEYRNNKDKYETYMSNKTPIIDENGNKRIISIEEYRNNKDKYKSYSSDKVVVVDENGKGFTVDREEFWKNKDKYKTTYEGRKHSEEAKAKMRKAAKKIDRNKDKNPMYGKIWIYNDELKQNKNIHKDELEQYTNEGWIKGRKAKYYKCNQK